MLPARTYFPSLDGLRCLAILPIVWHHATPRPLEGALGRGPLGVDLFFAISGFLITTLLLEERAREGTIALGRFWLRRSLRIFPLYYLVLGAFVLHAVFIREHGPARDYFLRSVPFYATYTSNWFLHGAIDHAIVFAFAWSLAAEEQFYLLWPPILRLLRGTARPAAVMALMVLLDQAAERGWVGPIMDTFALRVVRSFATPIGLGALLALAAASPWTARWVRALLGHRASSVAALAIVVVAIAEPWSIFPTHLALAALVGACALRSDHLLAPLLENRVARHIGVVSYGIYLLNVPIVTAARKLLGSEATAPVLFVVSTSAVVAVATLTFVAIERPLAKLRERFRASSRADHHADRREHQREQRERGDDDEQHLLDPLT